MVLSEIFCDVLSVLSLVFSMTEAFSGVFVNEKVRCDAKKERLSHCSVESAFRFFLSHAIACEAKRIETMIHTYYRFRDDRMDIGVDRALFASLRAFSNFRFACA